MIKSIASPRESGSLSRGLRSSLPFSTSSFKIKFTIFTTTFTAFNVLHNNIISLYPYFQAFLLLLFAMSIPSRPTNSFAIWSIHDNVRTSDEKSDKTPSIKSINFKDADMGMTITLSTRDLSGANYPEFVAWVQDMSRAC